MFFPSHRFIFSSLKTIRSLFSDITSANPSFFPMHSSLTVSFLLESLSKSASFYFQISFALKKYSHTHTRWYPGTEKAGKRSKLWYFGKRIWETASKYHSPKRLLYFRSTASLQSFLSFSEYSWQLLLLLAIDLDTNCGQDRAASLHPSIIQSLGLDAMIWDGNNQCLYSKDWKTGFFAQTLSLRFHRQNFHRVWHQVHPLNWLLHLVNGAGAVCWGQVPVNQSDCIRKSDATREGLKKIPEKVEEEEGRRLRILMTWLKKQSQWLRESECLIPGGQRFQSSLHEYQHQADHHVFPSH